MTVCHTAQSDHINVRPDIDFQKYLDELQIWTDKWRVKFNASTCQSM